MASDYAESTLLPAVLKELREKAPGITLDIMNPSDVSFLDVERGKVDLVINRFVQMPQSFHQITLWQDTFSCLLSPDNQILEDFNLDAYLAADHIWVSKTGMGVGVGVNPDDVQRLGWVDAALDGLGKKRRIRVFTRHYQAAMTLANALRQSNPDRAIQEATDLRNAREGELFGLLEGPSPENQKNEIENSIENSAAAQPTR